MLFDAVFRRGRFVNRGPTVREHATHGQLYRFQLGTLNGLKRIAGPAATGDDIDTLVRTTCASQASIAELPFPLIMREISACKMRGQRR